MDPETVATYCKLHYRNLLKSKGWQVLGHMTEGDPGWDGYYVESPKPYWTILEDWDPIFETSDTDKLLDFLEAARCT